MRRKKGQRPGEAAHPSKTWLPDTPGHDNRVGIAVTDNSHLDILDKHLDKLRQELGLTDAENFDPSTTTPIQRDLHNNEDPKLLEQPKKIEGNSHSTERK